MTYASFSASVEVAIVVGLVWVVVGLIWVFGSESVN